MTDYGTDAHELYRSEDPDTSAEAAHSIDSTKLERMVHEAIYSYADNGCIASDLLSTYDYLPYSSVTARFSALERKGYITCGPDKRRGPSGRNQRVMRAGPYRVRNTNDGE